jgi:hypothetical protein
MGELRLFQRRKTINVRPHYSVRDFATVRVRAA